MARGLIRRRPGELPAETTGFVGRQGELAQLAALLRKARLVTVTGPGGVGKTRVALRAAARLAGNFAHGVCPIELYGLHDPELLPDTVASCLGLPEREAGSHLDAVIDFLRHRRQLLVMDPCEHLVDACAEFVEALLREAPGVVILTASRQPLDVPGEHAYPILPLPVPSPGDRNAGRGDAVELFAQRASAVVPGFSVTDANRADVVRLCRRLDGIPLAIELATVRLRAVPLEQLVGRLEDRFEVLTGGSRDAVPHHQTLRTAIEWSYGLCSPAEQLLWARLSVFAGSFDLAAAEEVCAGGPLVREAVLEALIGLVDKSVVLQTEDSDGRYRLLDTIREFGAGLLAGAGDESRVRARHIARYLAAAAEFGSHAKASDQPRRFRELRREHANIRAAIEYALAQPGREREAARLATNLRAYWEISGSLGEGRHWLSRTLERFPGPSPERAWLLLTRGVLATLQGQLAEAVADLESCLPMAEQHGEALACAVGRAYLCLAFAFSGRHQEAAAMGAAAEARLETLGDFSGQVSLDIHMGYLHLLTGELELAIERCAQGLDRLGDSGEQWARSYLLVITGTALFLQGKHEASAESTSRALELKYELGDTVGTAYCLEALALLASGQGRHERVTLLQGAADPLWQLAGRRLGGTAIMEEFHARAEKAARDALGMDRHATLWRRAARCPLSEIVVLAVSGTGMPGSPEATMAHADRLEPLTSREREVAALVCQGMSNRQIAERLIISKRTVDAHLEHIRAKLGVSSRTQIVALLSGDRRLSR
jgi:predicted ATPase/DNA-binding CsgD family transcriptional regulator